VSVGNVAKIRVGGPDLALLIFEHQQSDRPIETSQRIGPYEQRAKRRIAEDEQCRRADLDTGVCGELRLIDLVEKADPLAAISCLRRAMVSAFEYALLTLMMPLSGTIIELPSASATPDEARPMTTDRAAVWKKRAKCLFTIRTPWLGASPESDQPALARCRGAR
jgi:hypothetical protein